MYALSLRVLAVYGMMMSVAFAVEAPIPPMQPIEPQVSVTPVMSDSADLPASSLPNPIHDKYFRSSPQWYLDMTASANMPEEVGLTNAASRKTSFDSGSGFSAALGYKPPYARGFLSQTRYEIEGAYRRNSVKNDFVDPSSGSTGSLHVWSAMMNAYFDLKNTSQLTPYVGGGLGITKISFRAPRLAIRDSDTVPAYQLMAGVSYEPEALPRVGFHLGYRYLSTFSDPEYHTSSNARVDSDYANHGVEAGVRLHF